MGRGPTREEGIVEVGPEVFDVFAADAEPEQARWQVLLAGDGGAAFDCRLHGAEAGGVLDDLQAADLHFAPEAPADEAAKHRWIKTIPGKGWFVYFRIYGPEEPAFDGSWQLPDFEPVTPDLDRGSGQGTGQIAPAITRTA